MELLYNKELKCIYCNKEMKSKGVKKSALRIKKTDDDFCRHYEGPAIPYLYEVFVCPHCGFAFTPSFSISDSRKNTIKNEYIDKLRAVSDYCKERTIEEGIRLWKLALLCAQISKQSLEICAGISVRIAWLYRYLNDENETRFLKIALDCYKNAYMSDKLKIDEGQLINLMFQISIRLNDLEESKVWLNEIYKLKDTKLISKAKEQFDELKEKVSV